MTKKILTLVMVLAMVTAIYACGNSEGPSGQTPQPNQAAPTPAPTGPADVVVPTDVEGKWSAIKINVADRRDGSVKEYTIKFGESFKIPDSDLTVEPILFLPSFVMQGQTVTSASNLPDNPAARIKITDGANDEYVGWLFQKFPDTHKYPHENLDIMLVEGIPS